MREQHDLTESEVLQFVQAVDYCGWRADQSAFVQPECRYSKPLFGKLPNTGQ